MKIRATVKLLNVNKLQPVKDPTPTPESLPGEWYASLVSMGRPGKLAIHYVHVPTMLSIVIPGKSLRKATEELPARLSSLLKRIGCQKLEPSFCMDTPVEILATNSRSVLSTINQMTFDLEYNLARFEPYGQEGLIAVENIFLEYLYGGKLVSGNYIASKDITQRFKKSLPDSV